MPQTDEFFKQMNQKQVSITAINAFMRQSCEFEVATRNSIDTVGRNLQRIGLGCASSQAINNGNGWNADTHCDGGSVNLPNGEHYDACETSTSPFHGVDYRAIKSEFDGLLDTYLRAAGAVRHSYYGSTHTHTSIAYGRFDGRSNAAVVDLPVRKMYRNVGAFMVRFLPVFKWLSMTNVEGSRAAAGNGYDCLDGDQLYEWFNQIQGGHTVQTDDYLSGMARGSMLRIYRNDVFHFENRMMDCNFSATMMAAWFCLNRAVALFAYDMARQDFQFTPTTSEIEASKQAAAHHRSSWKSVPKAYIVSEWNLLKSYLTKYFKLSGSIDALDALDKLIDCPIPQYLELVGARQCYDVTIIEKHFAVRVREKDNELRDKYLDGIKKFLIPHAPSLNDFHTQVALFLGVQNKQAVSLYQMLKRENVDLEFMAGRLVYMGE